jgi:hypothetical protein
VFGNRMLVKIVGPERDEVRGNDRPDDGGSKDL